MFLFQVRNNENTKYAFFSLQQILEGALVGYFLK